MYLALPPLSKLLVTAIGVRWLWHESRYVKEVLTPVENQKCITSPDCTEIEPAALHTIVGLAATATLLPATFALTQIPDTKATVWKLLDQFLAIFLAVVLAQAFFEVTDEIFPNHAGLITVVAETLRFVAMYVLTVLLTWPLRKEPRTFDAYCTCLAHFVSFLGVRCFGLLQSHGHHHAGLHPLLTIFCACVVLALLLAGKSVAGRYVFCESHSREDHEWHEATDDMGWDIASMVLAFLLTQAMHYVLLGKFDNLHEPEVRHTFGEVVYFACYAGILLLGGVFAIPWLDHEEHGSHWLIFNAAHVARNVIGMATAWGFLLSKKWLFLEHGPLTGCSGIFASLVLAIALSAVAVVLLPAMLMKGDHEVRNKRGKSAIRLAIQSFGLVCAWSWEECFDKAFEAAAEHVASAKVVRFGSVLFFTVVLVPLYVNFVKPKASSYDDEPEAMDQEEDRPQPVASATPSGKRKAAEPASSSPPPPKKSKAGMPAQSTVSAREHHSVVDN